MDSVDHHRQKERALWGSNSQVRPVLNERFVERFEEVLSGAQIALDSTSPCNRLERHPPNDCLQKLVWWSISVLCDVVKDEVGRRITNTALTLQPYLRTAENDGCPTALNTDWTLPPDSVVPTSSAPV